MSTEQPLTATEKLLPAHLGGHFGQVNKDPATLAYLVDRYAVQSMVDVGCGPGGMLDEAAALGVRAEGIDGDWFIADSNPLITCHDYTTGPLYWMPVDLIWCTEFVEHVEATYLSNILATFDAGLVLFLTAAPPGFPGWHHVHCQPESFWIDVLVQSGWALDTEATQWVRVNGSHIFSQRQGLVFARPYVLST
jgi:hypothetical protein